MTNDKRFHISAETLEKASKNKFVNGAAIAGGALAVNALFSQQASAQSVGDGATTVDAVVQEANAMITAVGSLGTAAFLVTLVPVAGVYVVRMFKMMVLGS